MLAAFGVLFALLLTWTTPAYAATLTVGQDGTHATLDAAIKAAQDNDTIVLLEDATITNTMYNITADKDITIDGDGYAIEADGVHFNIVGGLTIQDCDFTMHGEPTGNWMYFYMASGGLLTFDSADVIIDGSDAADNTCLMYFPEPGYPPADFVVKNSSFIAQNCRNNGISWGGRTSGRNNSITIENCTMFRLNNCAEKNTAGGGGIIGTFDISISDSTVEVINNKSYGSNGSNYKISNSNVTYSNNGTHGLSAGSLDISASTVKCENNGGMGITVNSGLSITDDSNVTVAGNAYGYDPDLASNFAYAAMRLYNNYDFLVDSTSSLSIKDNYSTGLYVRQGNLVVEEGADLEITGNSGTNSMLGGYGGGLYVGYGNNYDPTVQLPANVKIYNNHALNGGDDIYISEGVDGPVVTFFGQVDEEWSLDGTRLTAAEGAVGNPVADDCTGAIDGWYYDGIDKNGDFNSAKRWEAHGSTYDEVYVEQYVAEGTTTVTGPLALKAAHGLGSVAVDPADITVYMGGDQGYEGVITDEDDGRYDASNSLPEPGFYFVLPDEINQAFDDAGIAEVGEAADLSNYMTIYTHGYNGATGELHWKLVKYGATNSSAYGQFIYRIVPNPTPGQEPVPVRLQFTSEDGSTTFTNDTFDPAQAGALHQQYTMRLYTELVDANQVVFEVNINGTKYYNTMELQEGVLDVRYVTGDQDDVVTDVVNSEEELAAARVDNPDKAYAVMPDGTVYYINESQVDVTDSAAPSLLFDDLADSDDTGVAADHPQQLANRALDVITETGASFEHPWYQAKYLDLVDANNGNVYLTANHPVTVYWPYPAGTDQNTEFHLVHFADLDRDMNNGELSGQIESSSAAYVEVENTEHGIRFTTDGFSPFVLMWEGEGDGPAEPPVNAEPPASGTLTATGDNSLTAITVLGTAGGTCIAAAYVLRKRKAQ